MSGLATPTGAQGSGTVTEDPLDTEMRAAEGDRLPSREWVQMPDSLERKRASSHRWLYSGSWKEMGVNAHGLGNGLLYSHCAVGTR